MKRLSHRWYGAVVVAVLVLACLGQQQAFGLAVRSNAGFDSTDFPGNDDQSTGLVDIGFNLNFYGMNRTQCYVNNNGNVTLDSPLGTYTPFDLLSTSTEIIAPFFADVDTRAGNITRYGQDTVDGHAAFGVNWLDVGYYYQSLDKLNTFQLVLIDRSDISAGDFDIEFNYDQIQWETGDASGGTGGLGGYSARAGWANGAGATYELPGSAINGAFLDGGPNALISDSLNSSVLGRYVFRVRNGGVEPIDPVADGGATLGLLGLALAGLGRLRKVRK